MSVASYQFPVTLNKKNQMTRFTGKNIVKRRESFQLNRFKDCFSELSKADVSILEEDPPDGIAQIGDRKIAIELTQIFWDEDKDGMNKRSQEGTANMIMDLAEEKYNELQRTPFLQVNVSFTDKYGLPKYGEALNLNSGDKETLSDYVVNKVIENIPSSEKQVVEIHEYDENWRRVLDLKIESIYITRDPLLTENCWTASGGGIIPPITLEKIQKAIDKKNKRLNIYKDEYHESWLVIVEDSMGVSGYFDFRNSKELLCHEFESEFHRIFILRNGKFDVHELKITR